MATIYNRNNFGFFPNGDLRQGTNYGFTFGSYSTQYLNKDKPSIVATGGGGASYLSPDFISVDTTKTYQMICYARTITRGTQNNSLAGGHLGFSCYDASRNFIDLIHCGGIGNTTLSRNLNAGDTFAYITSKTGWYENATNSNSFNMFGVYPATHPIYSTAYQYTRLSGYRYNATSIDLMPEGDFRLTLASAFPNIGYSTPAGTPIMNAQFGGTYNYALSNPNYPETWTRYSTAPFTGENRNSGVPFRFATKFIKFLALLNYNQRAEVPQDHVWAINNIFFGECVGGRDYRNSLLP